MVLSSFRPGEIFERVECRYSNEHAHLAFVGPNAIAVAWIPYYSDPSQLPPGEMSARWETDASLSKVFQTGNRQPPEKYTGSSDLIRDLEQNDFRAAICIDAPTLYPSREGRPVSIEFLALSRIGLTATRLGWAKLVKHSEGVGNSCGHVLDHGIHVRLFARFKLSLAGQLIAKGFTGHWPPNATVAIDYVMDPESGRAEISFTGTVVPQLTSYVGWKAVHQYEIGEMSNQTYDSFIRSAGCQDAFARLPHKEVVVLEGPVKLKE
jgi:hypothetical protein